MSTSRHLTGLRRFAKAAVAVCASLGLVLAAGGCGASSGESKTIYFWNNLVGDDGPAMQRIVKEYNAQSDYKVVFQPMNGGDLTTKIYSVMQTGKNIPDIIIGDQFQTAVLQSQGLLDTMDDWQKVAPDLKESSFLPATWKGVTVNGKAYGIPLYLYQMAIYYNKDLVKKYNLQYILDDGFVTIDEIKDLKGKLPLILDGGECDWGVESTVVSVVGEKPTLFRPGHITLEGLERALGEEVEVYKAILEKLPEGAVVRSPGMKYKHYAPKADVTLLDGTFEQFKAYVDAHAAENPSCLCFTGEAEKLGVPCVEYGREGDGADQAKHIFRSLRALDEQGDAVGYARCPQKDGLSMAVYNRLIRAAAFRVIKL